MDFFFFNKALPYWTVHQLLLLVSYFSLTAGDLRAERPKLFPDGRWVLGVSPAHGLRQFKLADRHNNNNKKSLPLPYNYWGKSGRKK